MQRSGVCGRRSRLRKRWKVAALIKAHNPIDIKTRPRHPESNGIDERFNGTVRDETDNDCRSDYRQAAAIIGKLMQHHNRERLHAMLGYMTPATWHQGQREQFRQERRTAYRWHPCASQVIQQRFAGTFLNSERLPS